jgi:uncharacterized membrane protein
MTWLQRYQIRHYLANSVWIFPSLSMVAAILAVRVLHELERGMDWKSELSPGTIQAVLGTMASAMFTFVVFVCSALLVAVQLATAQLTPRIIAIVFNHSAVKFALTLFVFTFTFTLATMIRITDYVPPLTSTVASYSSVASLVIFLFLIDHVGKALRPSGAVWAVGSLGRGVIQSVYPRLLGQLHTPAPSPTAFDGEPTRVVLNRRDGVVLAFDIPGLVALARRADCIVELLPQVGDFVAIGDPLFRLFEGGEKLSDDALCEAVAVGQERTLEQDPAFAFRILVDIASKGLSPAINDPTTGVLALDQIHHLLRDVGRRCLDDERVRDNEGWLRLVYRTPDWADFVHLAVTEIRHFGGTSIQIARRLRAMLENLIQTLPDERRALLHQELQLLHRSAERCFTDPEDQALAEVSDLQGVGGKRGHTQNDQPQHGGSEP